jgi:ketosteroid isomerase-like protein
VTVAHPIKPRVLARPHQIAQRLQLLARHKSPVCEHGELRFAGADYRRKATKWRCPTGDCQPASTWINANRLHPLIPRETLRWRNLYKGHAAVEREFGRLKHEWALAPLRVRGIERVRLHAALTILAKLSCALARARARTTRGVDAPPSWRDTGQAMSEENVAVVRQGFAAWEADDLTGMLAALDDQLVTRRLAPMPDPGIWHGPEGAIDVAAEWIDTFDDFTMSAEEFIDAGDHVVVRVAQEGRSRGSGIPVTATF